MKAIYILKCNKILWFLASNIPNCTNKSEISHAGVHLFCANFHPISAMCCPHINIRCLQLLKQGMVMHQNIQQMILWNSISPLIH